MSLASLLVGALAWQPPRWSLGRAAARGRRLGAVIHLLDRRHRSVAEKNLERAFPNRSAAWHRDTARAAFEQMGRTITELLWSPALKSVPLESAVSHSGLEHLEGALRNNRGALIVSAHFGNWELMALALGRLGVPLTAIARPLDDAALEARLHALRTATGNEVLGKRDGVHSALRALRKGRAVVVLNDQNTLRQQAVFVPFFGRLAATTPLVAALHLRTGAPIVPAFMIPESDSYRLHIEPPLDGIEPPTGDQPAAAEQPADADSSCPPCPGDDDRRRLTAAITSRIEKHVRTHPQAWMWMHDRWRTRPLEASPLPDIGS